MRGLDAFGPRLTEAEISHLALLDEPAHRPHRVLDRYVWVNAVLVIKVDRVDAEPLQAHLARPLDMSGTAIDAVGTARLLRLAKLAGDQYLVAVRLQGPPEQLLVVAPAVHVGAVEMIDAEPDGAIEQFRRRLVAAPTVGPRQ